MELEGSIRGISQWWEKIRNPEIVGKWKLEFEAQRVSYGCKDKERNCKMIDFAIAECLWQADHYPGPIRPASTDDVFLRDDLDPALRDALLQGITTLRASCEDHHPGPSQMVNLVDPSLYCYECGRTEVLRNVGAEATNMPPWEKFLGHSGVIINPKNELLHGYSSKQGLQWLPAEFLLSDANTCEIRSYINSLHPIHHASLYDSVGKLFCHTVPLLEEVLTHSKRVGWPERLSVPWGWWEELKIPKSRKDHWEEDDMDYTFIPTIPSFKEFQSKFKLPHKNVSLLNRDLQVIVKIASLELATGESYDGGTWHVEGAADERIVAMACCYLDCKNISQHGLRMHVSVDLPYQCPGDDRGVYELYGLGWDFVQGRGECKASQGRVLAWPNTLQHKVGSTHLVDKTLPGKQTICCFFLVDPTARVRSTATVPPQQWVWVSQSIYPVLEQNGITEPVILKNIMERFMPTSALLTYEAACERRKRLMDERSYHFYSHRDYGFYHQHFSLSEH